MKIKCDDTHPPQQWRGSTADKDTRRQQQKKHQDSKEHVLCGYNYIDNVWLCKYLGSRFRADGDQKMDIQARIAAASTTAGKMRSVWASKTIPLRLKLRIYRTGVCSKLTYGAEAWRLDEKACAMLNGVNSHMVSHITGRSV